VDSRHAQFESLVEAYAPDLYRYAVWLGNGAETAEDLVQETCLRAWKALGTLRDARAARGWLVTILRREHARRFARLRAEGLRLDELDPERLAAVGGGDRTEVIALRQGLAALSADYREPLLLQVLGGYTCAEIGAMLGVEPGAVMTRLSRARLKLRRHLAGGREGGAKARVSR
jgi:RNA polymerase sigma-70 factor (ECF subfamily)